MMTMLPLARTPMDKKSGDGLRDHMKKMGRVLDAMTPWKPSSRRREGLRRKVQPGEVVVILEGGESAKHPLYEDAKVLRE